ncbi:MAG: ATPase, T2SS/T4P/T4SS family [Synechococcales bacterium]|nr:ATPase, T2SS/T4P/T4SS family [Synechococcales bacterium]
MSHEVSSDQELFPLAPFLEKAKAQACTDIYLQIDQIPYWRISGKLQPAEHPKLTGATFWQWARDLLLPEDLPFFQAGASIRQIVNHAIATVSVHAHTTVAGPALSLRLPTSTVPDMDRLGLPSVLKELVESPQGLILVTGKTGSGKSTTLVSLANYINQTACRHIVTLEDPLWFLYAPQQSIITQWVAGIHIDSLIDGFEQAQCIDADVIVLNELGDRPTLDKALQAAQSGYLVLACLHATRAIEALETLFSFYSEAEQPFIQQRLSKVLKAVLSQHLVPTTSGQYGRAAIHDLLVVNKQVQERLAQGHLDYLASWTAEDTVVWPRTMSQDLNQLLTEQRISQETFETVSQMLKSYEVSEF